MVNVLFQEEDLGSIVQFFVEFQCSSVFRKCTGVILFTKMQGPDVYVRSGLAVFVVDLPVDL